MIPISTPMPRSPSKRSSSSTRAHHRSLAAVVWNVDVPFYEVACLVRLVSQEEAEQSR